MVINFLLILFYVHAFAVSIDEIESRLQTNNITSIEQFIESIDPETRAHFVLMHKSRSLQGATFQKPRVIMFTKSGDMFLSFNGDDSQKNGNKIELILFDKKEAKFSAHEIDFSNSAPKVNKNPAVCIACHGSDIRPNWNGYAFWRGAYGSNDSRLSHPIGYTQSDVTEHTELLKFVKTYKDHSRYKHLVSVEDLAAVPSYDRPDVNRNSSGRMKSESLSLMNDLIMKANYKRFRRLIEKQPNYDRFKYSLLALMSCKKNDFDRSIPENYPLNAKYVWNSPMYQSDLFAVGKIKDAHYEAFLDSLNIEKEFLDTSFNIEYTIDLFENPEIVSIATSKFSTARYPKEEFAYAFVKNDADFIPYLEAINDETEHAYPNCEKLALKGKAELKKLPPIIKKEPMLKKGQEVFETVCLSCHQNPKVTSFLFSSANLGMLLKNDSSLMDKFNYRLDPNTPVEDRMPKRKNISLDEREAVKKYIESFR